MDRVYLDGDDCIIILSDGSIAICDAMDFDVVKDYRWSKSSGGYPFRTDNRATPRRTIRLHQALNPDWSMTDHIDGNRLNNRRSNLRQCTSRQNNHNRKPVSGSSSKFKGVTWDNSRSKWMAAIQVDGRTKTLGRFHNEVDAANAYNAAAMQHHKEFAKLN